MMKGNLGLITSHTIPPKIGPITIPKNAKKSPTPKIFPLCSVDSLLTKLAKSKPADIPIAKSNNKKIEKSHILAEFIKHQVINAPSELVIDIPTKGGSLSIKTPNFGAKRVANNPAGRYAQITKLTLPSIFSTM